MALQLLMPVLAWKTVKNMISIHRHHLLERHGLFVIILLGECLLSSRKHVTVSAPFVLTILILFAIWWIYFDWKYDSLNLQSTSSAFTFNYGHLVIYISLGIIAAGIGIAPEKNFSYLIPLGSAGFVGSLAIMNWSGKSAQKGRLLYPGASLAIFLLGFSHSWLGPEVLLGTNLLLLGVVALKR